MIPMMILLSLCAFFAGYWRGRRVELDRWANFIDDHAERFDKTILHDLHTFLRSEP